MLSFGEFVLDFFGIVSMIVGFVMTITADDNKDKRIGIKIMVVTLMMLIGFYGYEAWQEKRNYDEMYNRSVVVTDVYVYSIRDSEIELKKNGQNKKLKLMKNWRDGANKPIVEMSSIDIKYDPDTNTLTKVIQVNVIRDEFLKESVQ
jgi:hypothetical protein